MIDRVRQLRYTEAMTLRAQRPSRSAPSAASLWKVRLRSAPLLEFALLGRWHEEVRLFRWKWLARSVARHHRRRAPSGVLTEESVEPYIPGANVISLRKKGVAAQSSSNDGRMGDRLEVAAGTNPESPRNG